MGRRATRRLTALAAAATAVAALGSAAYGDGSARSGLHFRSPVALADGTGRTEPSLVVDSAGRIFVSAIGGVPGRVGGDPTKAAQAPGTPVWRSTDGGRTFTEHSTCSAGPLPTNLGGGDSALVLDRRDYLYGTDLWLGDDSGWYSTDHGNTCIGTPVSHRPVDDRNWLAYSRPDDAIYQVYDGFDGIWMSRADLGTPAGSATSLSDPVNVQIAPEGTPSDSPYVRDTFAPPGGVAVDQHNGDVYATWPDQHGVAVARSTDEGLHWTVGHISGTSVTGSSADDLWHFTPVAVDGQGNVYVAWSQAVRSPAKPNGIGLWLGWSTDGGRHWRKLRVPTRATAVFPTLALYPNGRVAVGWVDTNRAGDPNSSVMNGTRWRLEVADVTNVLGSHPSFRFGTVDPDVHDNTLFVGFNHSGDRGMGDFFSMAVTRDGALVVAYTRGSDGTGGAKVTSHAMVSVLPPH